MEHPWRWLTVSFLLGGGVGAAVVQCPADGVAIRVARFERASPTWVSEEEGEGASFSAEVPYVAGRCSADVQAELSAALLRFVEMPLVAAAPQPLEALAGSLLESWRSCRDQYPDGASAARWWERRQVSVLHSDAELLSMQVWSCIYTGGAHSNHRMQLATFDVATGRRVDAASAVAVEDRSRLAEAVARGVLGSGVSCDRERLVARAAQTQNIAVVEDGLLYSFDPYEVSGFAQGTLQYVVPWSVVGALRH